MSTNKNASQSDFQDYISLNDSQSSIDSASSTLLGVNFFENHRQHASPSYRRNNWNNRRFPGNFRNSSNNNPQHNVHSRSFSVYESYQRKQLSSSSKPFNSSFDCSRSRNSYNFISPKNKRDKSFNIMDYLHPSFMENPWAELEKNMSKKEKEELKDTHTEDENILTNLSQSEG